MQYDHKKIEKKWQKKWEEEGIYRTAEDQGSSIKDQAQKCYVLDMFPYPSGEGLHVGHPKGYIATDAYSRMKKMRGFQILHPMGWDAFGLPAENYAIKNKVRPRVAVEKNIKRFKEQLSLLGFNYDWEREINTTDPEFYKWTQWIFLQMFKKGLAYQSYEPINWCPSCQTGLANEDVENGACERCGTLVEKKPMRQWVLKITEYAERLLEGLEGLDWPESIKESQRNWIGRSEGAEIDFKIKDQGLRIKVFTTRPDTLFGATYLVLSPEHEIIEKCKAKNEKQQFKIQNLDEVLEYVEKAQNRGEVERTAEGREKTGVEIKGIKAVNPASGEEIPVWVADYVLGWYGTGAIMAVPAHDARDYEFAKKYGLPARQAVAPYTIVIGQDAPRSDKDIVYFDAASSIVKHWEKDLYYVVEFSGGMQGLVGGHVEEGEAAEETARREVMEESGYTDIGEVRQIFEYAYSRGYKTRKSREEECRDSWFFTQLKSGKRTDIADKETKKGLWMTADQILKSPVFVNHHKLFFEHYFYGKAYTDSGRMVNSGKFDGMDSEEAKWEITKFVKGKKVTKYKLRDWVFSRQRYWGEPIPIMYCRTCWESLISKSESLNKSKTQNSKFIEGVDYIFIDDREYAVVPVPEEELPVVLPEVEAYAPTGTGESPLANISEWVNTKCPKCGGSAKRETNTMPQWAGSSWYHIAYAVREISKPESLISKQSPASAGASAGRQNSKYQIQNKKEIDKWLPVDMYVGGAEHATRHLIYARFWHKFLYDIGVVSSDEPFARLQHVGLIGGADGRKMSKRYGNVINPDDVVATFGADTLRLYEMFMGPFDGNIPWSEDGILGPRRFLERVWRFLNRSETTPKSDRAATGQANLPNLQKNGLVDSDAFVDLDRLLHKTIKKVTEDIEGFRFNTAISALMILFNEMEKTRDPGRRIQESFLKLLAPFAPHIAEELWQAHRLTKMRTQKDAKEFCSIHLEPWPEYDPALIEDETFQLVVQVNGKARATITASKGISQEEAERLARADAGVLRYLEGVKIKKVIFVPDRLVNFVLE